MLNILLILNSRDRWILVSLREKTLDAIKLFSYNFGNSEERTATFMHGHGPFMVWHQKPTRRQLIGARIAMSIYVAIVMCALPMVVAFMFSQLAGPIWHWVITIVVFAGCVWYVQDTARGGLEVHDYEQKPSAT